MFTIFNGNKKVISGSCSETLLGGLYVPHLNFELACVAISEVLCVAVRISLSSLLLVLSLS